MSENNTTNNQKKLVNKRKKKIILFSAAGALLILLITVVIYIGQALLTPESLFQSAQIKQQDPKSFIDDKDVNDPKNDNDMDSILQNKHIINILLLGIDLDYKSYAKNGGDYHTDSIIVLSVNFDENTVDMISLPRDTFTHVPGVKGIYKLNAAINCGGGKTEAGFNKVCEAASWMLGGVSIDYYYAFELDSVIEIGDLIGGVDFDVDMSYRGNSGTYYKKGMQHLDGTGIYDYMRARKNATGEQGDKGRMNRGKAMLTAIFQKLKDQDMLLQLPTLINTVNKGLYTNLTLQQSIALANFAYNNIDVEKIESHTMEGKIRSALSWNFYFIDQKARTELIQQVYGIDVAEQEYVSYDYAIWLGRYGFKTIRYLSTASEVAQYIQSMGEQHLDADQQQALSALQEAIKKTQTAFNAAALSLSREDTNNMENKIKNLRESTEKLAGLIEYPNNMLWTVKREWYKDPCINEIDVDFN